MLVERVKTSAGASSSRHETQLPCFLFRIRKKKNAKVLVLESCHQKSTEFQSYCNTIFLQPVFKIKTIKRESFLQCRLHFANTACKFGFVCFLATKRFFCKTKVKALVIFYSNIRYSLRYYCYTLFF